MLADGASCGFLRLSRDLDIEPHQGEYQRLARDMWYKIGAPSRYCDTAAAQTRNE